MSLGIFDDAWILAGPSGSRHQRMSLAEAERRGKTVLAALPCGTKIAERRSRRLAALGRGAVSRARYQLAQHFIVGLAGTQDGNGVELPHFVQTHDAAIRLGPAPDWPRQRDRLRREEHDTASAGRLDPLHRDLRSVPRWLASTPPVAPPRRAVTPSRHPFQKPLQAATEIEKPLVILLHQIARHVPATSVQVKERFGPSCCR